MLRQQLQFDLPIAGQHPDTAATQAGCDAPMSLIDEPGTDRAGREDRAGHRRQAYFGERIARTPLASNFKPA
jgi:hypothetical protein